MYLVYNTQVSEKAFMEKEKSRLSIKIFGRVQGLGFRTGAKAKADELGLTGYAVNTSDGSIEIIAEGFKICLVKLWEWCFKGSILTRVDSVDIKWGIYTGEFDTFTIIRGKMGLIGDQITALKTYSKKTLALPEDVVLPIHVAIVPDGNRRWAKVRGMHTLIGHKKGLDNLVTVSRSARRLGIKYLTVWGFSTENWDRSEEEVSYLMNLFKRMVSKYSKDFHKEEVRFHHIGRKDRLPKFVLDEIVTLEESTKNYNKYYLNLALDYGGRDEILRAIETLSKDSGSLKTVTDENFTHLLDSGNCPAPDLIIRTSGEQRLSGFMSWQSVYSELYFASVHFPDFDENELRYALLDYSMRKRRFGK